MLTLSTHQVLNLFDAGNRQTNQILLELLFDVVHKTMRENEDLKRSNANLQAMIGALRGEVKCVWRAILERFPNPKDINGYWQKISLIKALRQAAADSVDVAHALCKDGFGNGQPVLGLAEAKLAVEHWINEQQKEV